MINPFLSAERQHDHQLDVAQIRLPVNRLVQTGNADAGMAYPLRFGVRDRHAKPDGGSDNLFALPEIFFKLERVFGPAMNRKISA